MRSFPKPNFIQVYDDGNIVLEYIQKDRRLLVTSCDETDDNGVTTTRLYVSFVASKGNGNLDEMWVEPITKSEQIAKFLEDKMGMKAEE